jgi:hypothetical protein
MILGNAPFACNDARDYEMRNPKVEVWSCKGLHASCQHKVDRIIEVHPKDWRGRESEVMAVLREKAKSEFYIPVILREPDPLIPTSVAYPIDDVLRVVAQRYMTCTVSYMLALLILEHTLFVAEPIGEVVMVGTFGDPDTEYWAKDGTYWQQRASVEYLLGICEGRGIKVTPDETSWLFKGRNYASLIPPEDVAYVGDNVSILQDVTTWGNSTK